MTQLQNSIQPEHLHELSPSSRECIQHILAYQRQHASTPGSGIFLKPPTSGGGLKCAAVLVLLYERDGRLRVLLTTRSKSLRLHPGQTALPGGKYDPEDGSFIVTAYREAEEEVALPKSDHIHTICVLEPFLSQTRLLCTPVIALLTDLTVLDQLRAAPSEVDRIFSHPLDAFLDPTLVLGEKLVEIGSEDWPYEEELYNTIDRDVPGEDPFKYRMHRFRSIGSPVKGLTADIMIRTAEIAYNRSTTFERYAPGQKDGFIGIIKLLTGKSEVATSLN